MRDRQSQPDNPTRRLGAGMWTAAWIVGLMLLALLFSDQLERRDNPNRVVEGSVLEGGIREVALKRNRAGHYVATGSINGQPLRLLLDTGATMVSVPGRLAERLRLRRGPPMRVTTAAGEVTTYATRLDEVRLGEITLHNVRASINPFMEGMDVLLGMSFLKQIEFTQRGNTLTLRQYP